MTPANVAGQFGDTTYTKVTFREPEAAMRACVDPSPVIDGRRANCNLASLGVHRSKPPTLPHANGVVAGTTGYYPYFQFGQGGGGGGGAAAYAQGQGYGLQYPPMLQYSAVTTTAGVTGFTAQLYGGPMSLAPTPTAQAGMTMAVTSPSLPSPTAHPYRLIPAHFAAPSAPEQPLA
ncbi:hypothetical protein C4D60_Mb10t18680 [Musa balbisiana]|uniref:RRM domain-containing protein n=1 Tax=Musa balbisiana TaxID=52838 RepID=A0A4S8IY68_MUSBA|nr:hypothetical protein C4D60_Mb10t18680 [Musa balbisiana]